MRIPRWKLLASLLLMAASIWGQAVSQQAISLVREYHSAHNAKNYPEALRLLDQILSLPEFAPGTKLRGAVLYNKACNEALLGHKQEALSALREAVGAGLIQYSAYAHDHDLDSLRGDKAFKAILREVKTKAHLNPLHWDTSAREQGYALIFDAVDDPRLKQMRDEFQIDDAVVHALKDYERLVSLTTWVSRQWEHSNTAMASSSDPRVILREGRAGGKFICVDYAIVTAAVARAYGFYSRQVALLPHDVESRTEAHSIAEVWLPKFHKWVLADGQFGIVPELHGKPLNAIELQTALASDADISCRGNQEKCDEWKEFILPELYYFKIAADQRRFDGKPTSQLVLVPKGAPQPHKVNGGSEYVFAGARYTSNPSVFYQNPTR